ncbi:HWE histidine kinase domain-containing protein [Sphingorhabdus sp.]|uniref:HWE histidine kinase domain-containing protein n=1 Tax=Sphingorhabdus sp. TaxID=1902408 RepID=UPI00359442D3
MSTDAPRSSVQKAGEASVDSFRRQLGPFVVAAEKTRMPMMFLNVDDGHSVIFANDAFLNLTGYTREEVLAENFQSLLANGFDEENIKVLKLAFNSEMCGDTEVHYKRKDGTEFWASMFITPVSDKSGKIVQYFVSLADLTAHRLENKRCKALIDELNHRVKNTLATFQFIVNHALKDPAVPSEARVAIERRIQALARSHDLLTATEWDGAGLHDLVQMAMKPFHSITDHVARITISGSNIVLPPKITLAIAIALNELATNSIKYGALSNGEGRIDVDWHLSKEAAGDRLLIRWQERNGPLVTPPSHKGFGTWILGRGISHELNGKVTLDYLAEGVKCQIDIPAPSFIRSSQ